MYLLQFLALPANQTGVVDVEYRLACSGELCNRRVRPFDHRKSDGSRILLRKPLELFVVGHPFNKYPQELCARLSLQFVTESEGSGRIMFLPDEDVIEDFCSILSLLSRRLISPIVKTREGHRDYDPGSHDALGSYASELPAPILPVPETPMWKQRPVTIITSMEGQKVRFNNPPLVGVDPLALSEFLMQLPKMAKANQLVYAARLYRTGLELIETRPDITYLLLISTVESLADVAFSEYQPEEREKLDTTRAVQQCALELGLNEEQARQLALAACEKERWLKKKFKKFVLDYALLSELEFEDRVFLLPASLCPRKEDIPKTLGRIYDARSINVHVASPFPRSINIGTGPTIDIRALGPNWLSGDSPKIPPVTWFERVVSLAANKFLLEKSGVKSAPCVFEPWTEPYPLSVKVSCKRRTGQTMRDLTTIATYSSC